MPFLAVAHLASLCGLRALDRLEALGVGDVSQSVVGLLLPTPQSSIEHALPIGLAVGFGLGPSTQPLPQAYMPWLWEAMIPGPQSGRKASRGFEPRSLDSESRMLTVTPRGQMLKTP